MSVRKEINQCIKNGCKGACCGNLLFPSLSDKELKLITPAGVSTREIPRKNVPAFINLITRRRLQQGNANTETTVYYTTQREGVHTVILDGPCPRLQPDGSCEIYVNRPKHCKTFEIGSEGCDNARTTAGLPLIPTIKRRPRS